MYPSTTPEIWRYISCYDLSIRISGNNVHITTNFYVRGITVAEYHVINQAINKYELRFYMYRYHNIHLLKTESVKVHTLINI